MAKLSIVLVLTSVLITLGCKEKELGPTFKTWRAGDRVPGYVLDYPSGSRADVKAKGSLSDGWWKLEVSAPLTGQDDDHNFTIGTDIAFSLYVTDGADMDGKNTLRLIWSGSSGNDTLSVYDLAAHGLEPPVVDGGRDGIWDSTSYCLIDPEPIEGDAGIDTLYLHSAHDSTLIYFLLSWPDGSLDVEKDMWWYDGHQFTRNGDEDIVVFIFPTDNPPTNWESEGGGEFFPDPGYPPDGEVNVWLWGAGRTNPLGYADDEFADSQGRRSDEGNQTFVPNYELDINHPLWVQDPRIPPSLGEDFLLEEEAIEFEETLRP